MLLVIGTEQKKRGMKMIKKIVKVLLTVLLIVPSIAALSGSGTIGYAEGSPEDGQAAVTIHKKKMTTAPSSPIQNTGEVMSEFDQYDGLGDVEFNVYNVSAEFYELLNTTNPSTSEKYTRTEAIAEVQKIVPIASDGRLVANEVTDLSGEFTVNLDKKVTVGGVEKDAVYLFIETPKDGVTIAENMVLAFPVYQLDNEGKYTDTELSEVHLYPKNVVSTDGRIEVIKKGTANEEGLNGAKFILQKMIGEEAWVVVGANNGLYTWEKRLVDDGQGGTKENPNAMRFESGKEYSIVGGTSGPGIIEGTSLGGATGHLIINNLENGDYTLVEVEAPENAGMIKKYIETNFTIPNENTVPIDIMNDTIIVDKNEEKENHAIGDEIDYTIKFLIPEGIQDVLNNGNKRYNKVELKDTHDSFLTFINDATKFTLMNDSDEIPMTAGATTYYTISEAENSFTVNLTPEGIALLNPGATLTFAYKMKLNDTATPDNGYKNKAEVEVSGDTDTLKDDDTETVYTGGKRFVKIDGDVTGEDQVLAGAKFVVRNADSNNANYLFIDPVTKEVSWVSDVADATEFESDSTGIIDITGLAYGTYYLEETQAPADYVLLENRIEFEVSKESYKQLDSVPDELKDPTKVLNKHKGTLPSTGGMGIIALLTFGVAAFGIAGLYFKRSGKSEV